MKRLQWLWFFCVLLLCAWSAPGTVTHAETRTLRVGIPSGANVDMVTASEEAVGTLTASLTELSKYTNWNYTYISGGESELRAWLAADEIDLIAGMYYRGELEDEMIYPRYVAGYTYALLVSNPDDDAVQKDDFRSMQGKRIAVVSQMKEAQRLLGYLSLNNINCTILYTDSAQESIELLEAEEVEMALLASEDANGFRMITRFVVEPFYMVASSAHEELVDQIDDAYAMILDVDPDFVDELYERRYGLMDQPDLELTRAEKLYIAGNPVLRVAVLDDMAPLQDLEEGSARGIIVELLMLVGSRTGLQVRLENAASIPAALEMLDAGEIDAIMGLPFTEEAAAENDMVLTRPFIQIPRVAVSNVHKEYPSQGLTLAVIPGMEFLIDSFTGNVVYGDTFVDCMTLVNNGAADYTYGSTYFLEYGVQSRTYGNVQTFSLPGVMDNLGLGLRRPVDSHLLTALNKVILRITEEELQDIVLHNTTLQARKQSLQSFIYAYPLLVVIMVIVFAGIILVATLVITLLKVRHSRALFNTQFTDKLTGALNLTGFRQEANRLLGSPVKYALTYATVRNFHFVNDRYGYEEGDDVLRRIAAAYRADMGEGEIFCRASGGAFVALRRYDQQNAFSQRMDRFLDVVSQITPRPDPGYHIRTTTGVYLSEGPEHGDVFSMMDRANAAQQQIKTSSEVSMAVYQEGSYDNMIYLQEIESRMEPALKAGEFHVYLQPKCNLTNLLPSGAEALVRWYDGERIIPPSDFIPQFERNGFIARLDQNVFEQCCKLLRRWIDTGMPTVPISINVSRVQLYSPNFVEEYVAIRDSYQIPHGLLELEFTESIMFEDVDKLISIVNTLHANGFECSIDDFGKGYSSLTMLKNIPADILKLDAQFFDSGIDGQRDTIIIESVVEIAKSLGMTSIAEGIEHRQQVRLLQMIGCDMVQGYVFSRPLDISTFERYLRQKLIEKKDPFAPLDEEE